MAAILTPPGPPPRVLFVDDEAFMLRSMERYVRTWADRWEVVCVSEADDAFRALERQTFDVVVSDLHMPSMDGVELLREVQKRHPETVRMILSGNADRYRAAVATSAAHQFLDKSASPGMLRRALERAHAMRGVLADSELRAVVTSENALASAPALVSELALALQSPRVSMMQVGAIVERDVAMTARILQVVSSAFFALPRQMTDAGEAIAFLGAETVHALVVQAKLFEVFEPTAEHFDMESFQALSLTTSQLSRDIARSVGIESLSAMAGMLLDVGLLLLAARTPSRWDDAAARAARTGVPLHVAERERLGTTHAEVGAYLLGVWGVDDDVVYAVAHHHREPSRPIERLTLSDVVRIADTLARDPEAALDRHTAAVQIVEQNIDRWRARAARLTGR
jgi:HD-like signal output (HDOD) protein